MAMRSFEKEFYMLNLHKKYIAAIIVVVSMVTSVFFVAPLVDKHINNGKDNSSIDNSTNSYYEDKKEQNSNENSTNNNGNTDKEQNKNDVNGDKEQNKNNGEGNKEQNSDVSKEEQQLESGEQLNNPENENTTPVPPVPTPVPPTTIPSSNTEMRGIWISYLELERLLKGKSSVQFSNNMDEVFKNVRDLGLNTVFVHTHSHSDAYYPSDFFPWSRYGGGNQGYDPLKIMVEKAHKYGLKFHAWFNPYRVDKRNNRYENYTIMGSNNKPFLDPSKDVVRELICNTVKEVVSKYDVDGIQFDDYFYATTETGVDIEQYNKYLSDGGSLSQPDWRRSNVDTLVKSVYNTVKSVKSNVVFGISPQGNNQNNFNSQYANVSKWAASTGYVDYIAPQLYWGFEHRVAAFPKKLAEWSNIVTSSSVKLYLGLGPYRSGKQETGAGAGINEWIEHKDVIARQIKALRENKKQDGFILFDYKSLFNIAGSADTGYAEEERENIRIVLSGRINTKSRDKMRLQYINNVVESKIHRKFYAA